MRFNADNSKERLLVLTVSGQFEGVGHSICGGHWDSFSLLIWRLPDPSPPPPLYFSPLDIFAHWFFQCDGVNGSVGVGALG